MLQIFVPEDIFLSDIERCFDNVTQIGTSVVPWRLGKEILHMHYIHVSFLCRKKDPSCRRDKIDFAARHSLGFYHVSFKPGQYLRYLYVFADSSLHFGFQRRQFVQHLVDIYYYKAGHRPSEQ